MANTVFLDAMESEGKIRVSSVRGEFFVADRYHASIEVAATVSMHGRIYPIQGSGISDEVYKGILREAAKIVKAG